MSEFSYRLVESQIAAALPAIRTAAEFYWEREGVPGQDCGPYIFFESIVGTYVDILLEMNESPGRNAMLREAFSLVESMLESDDVEVRNLAYIGVLEWQGPWWYSRALPFIGSAAQRELDTYSPDWRTERGVRSVVANDPVLIDLYGVRSVIAKGLAQEGVELQHVPGTTHLAEPKVAGLDQP